jgi:cell division protein FtsL
MNAAAKMINQNSVFQGQLTSMRMSKQVYLKSVLMALMLLSALAVIYMTNITRFTCSQLELAEETAHQLRIERGQLLLEQASLLNPERLERIATQALRMSLPVSSRAYLLQLK